MRMVTLKKLWIWFKTFRMTPKNKKKLESTMTSKTPLKKVLPL